MNTHPHNLCLEIIDNLFVNKTNLLNIRISKQDKAMKFLDGCSLHVLKVRGYFRVEILFFFKMTQDDLIPFSTILRINNAVLAKLHSKQFQKDGTL